MFEVKARGYKCRILSSRVYSYAEKNRCSFKVNGTFQEERNVPRPYPQSDIE